MRQLTTGGHTKYTNIKPDITAQIALQQSQVLPPLCWSNKENNFSSFEDGRVRRRTISQSVGDILLINNVAGIISDELTG